MGMIATLPIPSEFTPRLHGLWNFRKRLDKRCKYREELKDRLCRLGHDENAVNATVAEASRKGTPAGRELLKRVEQQAEDLLVLGFSGKKGRS